MKIRNRSDRQSEDQEVVVSHHRLHLGLQPQLVVVRLKCRIELREMVLHDELAKVIEGDVPDHDDRGAASVMQKADFCFLHEVFLGNVRHLVDEVFDFLADAQRDAVRAVILVVLREELSFAVIAELIPQELTASLHIDQVLAGVRWLQGQSLVAPVDIASTESWFLAEKMLKPRKHANHVCVALVLESRGARYKRSQIVFSRRHYLPIFSTY